MWKLVMLESDDTLGRAFYVTAALFAIAWAAAGALRRRGSGRPLGSLPFRTLWWVLLAVASAKLGATVLAGAVAFLDSSAPWTWMEAMRDAPWWTFLLSGGPAVAAVAALSWSAGSGRLAGDRQLLPADTVMAFFDRGGPARLPGARVPRQHLVVGFPRYTLWFQGERPDADCSRLVLRQHWPGELTYFYRREGRLRELQMGVDLKLRDLCIGVMDFIDSCRRRLENHGQVTTRNLEIHLADKVQQAFDDWTREAAEMADFLRAGHARPTANGGFGKFVTRWCRALDVGEDPATAEADRRFVVRAFLEDLAATRAGELTPWGQFDIKVKMGGDVPEPVDPMEEIELLTPMVKVEGLGGHLKMDRFPVTVGAYDRFLQRIGSRKRRLHEPRNWARQCKGDKADHPVVGVSWHDAEAYARWAGKRLPTREEWERSAGGRIGGYPWPGQYDPELANCHENRSIDRHVYPRTTPVCMFPEGKSPVGCYDMAGNVGEWCADADPARPGERPVKSASWQDHSCEECLKVGHERWIVATAHEEDIGFRCCAG